MTKSWMVWIALVLLTLLNDAVARPGGASKDLYKTLGVAKDADEKELKRAYRKLSLKHHPDKVPPEKRDQAEKKFKEINEAYETLSDGEKRSMYDQYGEAGLNPQFQPGGFGGAADGFSSFSSQGQQGSGPFQFFSGASPGGVGVDPSMFGGGGVDLGDILRSVLGDMATGGQRRRPSPSPPPSQKSYTNKLPCSLEDLATGATKKMKVTHPVKLNPYTNQKELQDKIYHVHLKPGWKSGTKIKYPAKDGFPAITFVVQEKPHAFLERRGNDLHYSCKLTPRQAEKGARIKIPLPNGETIAVSTVDETPTKDGHVMNIAGKGMPIKGVVSNRGNLVIEFRVVPQTTSAA